MNLTEKSGFFPEYYLNIRNVCTENDINQFSTFQNDLERAQYVDRIKLVRDHDLKIKRKFVGKSAQQSLQYKEKGNLAFKNQKYIEALVLYTKSLIAIPAENSKYFHIYILFILLCTNLILQDMLLQLFMQIVRLPFIIWKSIMNVY